MTFQHLQNDIAEQRAFRIDFEPTLTGEAACSGRLTAANKTSEPAQTFESGMMLSSFFYCCFQRIKRKA